MAYDPQNIFAKILRGELPAAKLYEDEHTLAFLDIMPQAKGHTLIIPKQEAETLFELTPEMAGALLATSQKVGQALKKALNAEGIVVMQLNGAAAGQTVPHYHLHLIPDSIAALRQPHGVNMANATELQALADQIKAAF